MVFTCKYVSSTFHSHLKYWRDLEAAGFLEGAASDKKWTALVRKLGKYGESRGSPIAIDIDEEVVERVAKRQRVSDSRT